MRGKTWQKMRGGLSLRGPGGERPPAVFAQLATRCDGGATGQLSGIWLGLWASASGGAAQSASMFIVGKESRSEPDADEDGDEGVDEGGEDPEGPWGR